MAAMSDDISSVKVFGHQSSLLEELHNFQKEGFLCDVVLYAEDGIVRAHGAVITAASPYFKQRLDKNRLPGESDSITFRHVKLSVLSCVVEFIYTGILKVTSNNISDVSELCSELQLTEAAKICQGMVPVKCEQGDKQTADEVETSVEQPYLQMSDNYAESTDVENNVTEVVAKEKQKVKRKYRKRSQSALGDDNEPKDNRKKMKLSKKEKTKPLKVPKLAICIKKRKDNENGIVQTKPRKTKRSERQRKGTKPLKVTDKKMNTVTESVSDTEAVKLETTIKTEVNSDAEDSKKAGNSSGEEPVLDDLNGGVVKNGEADLTDSGINETTFPKQCHVCKEMFETMKSFTKHIKTHNVKPRGRQKSKQDVWPCCVCGRQLTTAVRQACHHYSKHGIPYDESLKLHACDIEGCKYITASRHYLQIHKKGRHGNERPHVCEFCGKGFKLPSALVTHLNIHTNSKIYRCEECDLTFNQKGGLDIHVKKHHKGQASWTELCHLCSEKFLQKAELSWHMYIVHQIPLPDRYKVYSCDLCDYQTIRKNKLERHQDAHNDNRSWTCDVCGKKFVTKSYLNRHMRYHGEKSFKCTYDGCNYACVDNIGLKKHIRLMHTHKNYKPFVCSLCQYKTGLRGNLDKHIRTVHNLDVVTKHTVHLKMKFKDRQSGDILTKEGQLVNTVEDHRGEDPRRLQAMLDSGDEEQDEPENKPIDMIMKDGIVYTAMTNGGKMGEEESTSQISSSDSDQLNTTAAASSQSTSFPYVYNGMQYLTPVTQIPYTMVHLPSQIPQAEMYATIDPMALTGSKFSEFY